MLRTAENDRGYSLFYECRASTVFGFIDRRGALSLAPQQSPSHRRPPKVYGVGKVEDVVKPIAVGVADVVSQPVTHRNTVTTKSNVVLLVPATLPELDL